MKSITKIFIYLFTINYSHAQVQWAKQIYSSSIIFNEYCSTISDGANNYLIGKYASSLFLPDDTLNAMGIEDIFVAKFDANGNNLWSKRLGDGSNSTLESENASAVYDNVNQCIYLAGHFVNSIDFPGTNSLYGNSDVFIAKMDLNGNFLWAKKGGGLGNDQAKVYLNPYGKIYLVTQSNDSAHFDSFHIGDGGAIVTYDTDGNCLSAEVKYNFISSLPNFVYLDFIEKDIVYYGTYSTNTFTLDTVSFNSMGDYDAFIARADSTGKIKWVHKIRSQGRETIGPMYIDSQNNIYLSTTFSQSINFIGTNLTTNGSDIGLAKLDHDGNLMWVKQFNLNSTDLSAGLGIKLNSQKNIIVSGYFRGAADFGNVQYTANSERDMFLARFDTLGNCLNFFHFGKASGSSLSLDNNDNIYVSGNFFNNVSIGNINLNMQGYTSDIYLAKFDSSLGNNTRTAPNNTLIIYANPNKGTCNITIPDDLKNSPNLTLQIYNAQGSLIQKQEIQQAQDKIKLNLDAEAKGMYNVSLGDGYKMYYGKIVFE